MDFNNQILVQGFSAFSGAFFAFLFLRLSEFFSKLYQRQVQHYNSLVILETQLNEIGGIIHDNLYILPNFIKVITSGNVYFNNLRPIPIDKNHYTNLYDLIILNELFSYNYQVRKINDDMETACLGYQDIKNALIEKNITSADYLINSTSISTNLKQIEIFLTELEIATVKLLARIRVQMRYDKPLGTKLQFFFIHSYGAKLKKEEIEKEAKKLNKEIEETKTESQKEINEILKKYNVSKDTKL